MGKMQRAFQSIHWLLSAVFLLYCVCHAPLAMAATLKNLDVHSLEGNRYCLRLSLTGPVSDPKNFAMDSPARVIVDLPNVKNGLSKAKSRSNFDIGVLNKVLVAESHERTRVVIDLNELVPYEVVSEGSDVMVIFDGALPSDAIKFEKFRDNNSKAQPGSTGHCDYSVKYIDFRRGAKGEGLVVIDLSQSNMPIDYKEMGSQIRLRFKNAQLPKALQKKYDVMDFGTPVTFVNAIQVGNEVELVIQIAGNSENIAYQTDKQFTVEVRPLTAIEKKQLEAKNFEYTGERLSLNFQDIEVRAVLQLIAEFTGLNIVTSDSVTGTVTLRLHNVPWDEALDIILKTKGLAKREMGDVLMIGPSEEMAAREKQELQSVQQVQDLEPLRAEYFQINYAKAADIAVLLKSEGNSILSTRGAVSVDERTNTLLVQDTVRKLEEIQSLITRLDVPVRQVLVESRIVFANDDFESELGVNLYSAAKFRPGQEPVVGWGGNATAADAIAQGAQPASQALLNRLNVNLLPSGLPSGTPGFAQFGLAIARLPGGTILDLELLALENEGLGKIIASPRLITSNQQLAYIEAGEEIPYQETTSSGAASIAFKKAVLRLEVIPQITPDDNIILDLKVNQDSRGQVTAGVPAINTRQLQTKVLVANGETVVLGGIYQQNKTSSLLQVPFLGQLPLIGWLFKQEVCSDERNELLIFVTPKIIQDGMMPTS